jgi:hypothetical protein
VLDGHLREQADPGKALGSATVQYLKGTMQICTKSTPQPRRRPHRIPVRAESNDRIRTEIEAGPTERLPSETGL